MQKAERQTVNAERKILCRLSLDHSAEDVSLHYDSRVIEELLSGRPTRWQEWCRCDGRFVLVVVGSEGETPRVREVEKLALVNNLSAGAIYHDIPNLEQRAADECCGTQENVYGMRCLLLGLGEHEVKTDGRKLVRRYERHAQNVALENGNARQVGSCSRWEIVLAYF